LQDNAALIDGIKMEINDTSLFFLNVAVGLIMFGVALDLKTDDFRRIIISPKGPLIGLFGQFILLPALTFFMIMGLTALYAVFPFPGFYPHHSIALGLILIAACPGGNFSNFLAYLAKGNTALSVSMTSVSTFAALVMTPFNLTFWGGLNPDTKAILTEVQMDTAQIVGLIFMLVFIPVLSGIGFSQWQPALTEKLKVYFKRGSIVFFLGFVIMLVVKNWDIITGYLHFAAAAVIIHNLSALAFGYGIARFSKLPEADCRAISIEVGIQNSALGLSIIMTSFHGLGGMALVAGLWGTWHLISGLSLALFWARRPPKDSAALTQESPA